MDSIQDILQCKWCLSLFTDPVHLPCGESICEKHTEELRADDWKCLLCGLVHKLDESERYPPNKPLVVMLKANISMLDFGPTYNDAKERVKRLKSKRADLKLVINEPRDFVCTELYKHKNKLDLVSEEIKQLVDEVCSDKRKEIDAFQTEANQAIFKKTAVSLTNLDRKLERKIKNWTESLDKLVVNEPLWKKIADEAKQYQEQIDNQLSSALDTPPSIANTTMSIERRVWIKLSHRLDKKSMWIGDLSTIAKSKSWPKLVSETFTVKDHLFNLNFEFVLSNDKLCIGVYLCLIETIGEPVSVSWTFNVTGKDSQLITSTSCYFVFKEPSGWGCPNILSTSEVLYHPAYDAQEDMIRVQVVIHE